MLKNRDKTVESMSIFSPAFFIFRVMGSGWSSMGAMKAPTAGLMVPNSHQRHNPATPRMQL
jgi:hypothetical protein